MQKSAEIRSKINAKLDDLTKLNDTEGANLTEETRDAFEVKYDALKQEIENLKKDEQRALDMEKIRLEAANEERKINLANAAGKEITDKEEQKVKRTFSISSFIQEARTNSLSGLNKEMHDEAVKEARELGRSVEGFGLPSLVAGRSEKRTMNATTDTAGGFTVETEVQTIVDYLYNKLTLRELGADFLTGLSSDIAFPVRDNAITNGWLTETGASSEVSPTFEQRKMTPKRLGAYIDLSNQLIRQSSASIDNYITSEIGASLVVDLHKAAINGTGSSNQPTGILNTSGIGSVAIDTNGGPITWEAVVQLATEVAIDNAEMGNLNYLTNPKVRGAMQTIEKASGTAQFILDNANSDLNGYGLGVTQNVPSNLTKGSSTGVCSALIYGNFNDLKIGQWGGLDLLVDQYTQATSGTTRVVANGYFDILALRPESFAAIADITT